MPCVLNMRDHRGRKDAIYIGRGSLWGNPFVLGRDGDRTTVVKLFFEYLRSSPDLIARLDDLRGRDLICFCAPLLCHGDILQALANASVEEREEIFRIGLDL